MTRCFLHPLWAERELDLFIELIHTVSHSVYCVWIKWAPEAFPLTQSKYLSLKKVLICHFPQLNLSKKVKQTWPLVSDSVTRLQSQNLNLNLWQSRHFAHNGRWQEKHIWYSCSDSFFPSQEMHQTFITTCKPFYFHWMNKKHILLFCFVNIRVF